MSRKYAVHLCSFTTGLDELSAKDQRDESAVLRFLKGVERVSIFEVTATPSLANTFQYLCDAKLILTDGNTIPYPWIGVQVTEEGEKWIREGRKRENRRGRKGAIV